MATHPQPANRPNARRRQRVSSLVAACIPLLLASGCHREFYRSGADREAFCLIAEKQMDPRWTIDGFDIQADQRSRFADPFCPSHPPKPVDDPTAECLDLRPHRSTPELPPFEGTGYLALLPVAPQDEQAQGDQAQRDPLADTAQAVRLATPQNAFLVGLLNSRDYQDRRESLYLAALDVSLERFAFGPQLFAAQQFAYEHIGRALAGGTSRSQVTIGPADVPGNVVGPGESPGSSATDGQALRSFAGISPLQGTGFGVGQFLTTGGALLLRFANQVVFELSGPMKGTLSQSELSLDVVQPLLQGGGHAVALEPLTQAERNLLYELRSYARFRREFFVSVATGARLDQGDRLERTQDADESDRARRRRVGYLPLVEQLQVLRNEQRNLQLLQAHLERFVAFERAGEISRLQVDQVRQDLAQARSRVLRARERYFNNLDRFKIQLGIPTNLPLAIDKRLLAPFEMDERLCDFPQLPQSLPPEPWDPDEAVALALANRLDLMNERARLVDHWRKIDVAANGLMGVLDLEYNGSWLTPDPSVTSQPLNFNSRNARHRVSIDAELPLVRKRERNIYRATLIEYQQARRRLMEAEDTVRLEVRTDLRALARARSDFEIQREAVVLACRRVDQARRILDLPPRPGERRELGTNSARDLLEAQQDLVDAQNDLVEVWVDYQAAWLELQRDTETLDVNDLSLLQFQNADLTTSDAEPIPAPDAREPELAPP